jgi:oligopeptide transport system ATP-binding protein
MGLISRVADRVLVMYLGHVMEASDLAPFTTTPLHPYSRALLAATPPLEGDAVIEGIPGLPARMTDMPGGCPFHPRCHHADVRCTREEPELRAFGAGRRAACHMLVDGDLMLPAAGGEHG